MSDAKTLTPLYLRKHEEKRLRGGHLWVYSNEIDTKRSPLKGFEMGEEVVIKSADDKFVGIGYINPKALLCVRLVSRDAEHGLDKGLIVHRLNIALSLREKMYDEGSYRLMHGEGDFLPGLVVDRYGDYAVAQITTQGMEHHKQEIVDAIVQVLKPKGVLLRNDAGSRKMEELESYVEVAYGEVPDVVEISEDGVKFEIPLHTGQKTGWFFDQRENRVRLQQYAKGARVLDVFSYIGSWGMHAAKAGAEKVTCIDISEKALDMVERNAEINGFDNVDTIAGNAFDVLKELRHNQEKFDVVIIDPPAFMKKRKDIKEGTIAYRRLNQAAMQVLEHDGYLVSCSCSHHMTRENLNKQILQAARHVDRNAQVLEQGYQGLDHPMNPAIPETEYLKTVFARITRV